MAKQQLQKEWKKIIKEVHDRPNCKIAYPKQVVFIRRLLLFAEVLLEKIENKENVLFNSVLYQRVMAEYYRQKLCLKI